MRTATRHEKRTGRVPSRDVLAAFTMASTSSWVMSPWLDGIRVTRFRRKVSEWTDYNETRSRREPRVRKRTAVASDAGARTEA